MYNEDTYRTTKRLLRDLKYFTIHVVIYLPVNVFLVILAFQNPVWFLPVIFWSLMLLYHGFMIYTDKNRKKIKSFLSFLIPS